MLELPQGVSIALATAASGAWHGTLQVAPEGPPIGEVVLNAALVGLVSLAVGFGVGLYRGAKTGAATTQDTDATATGSPEAGETARDGDGGPAADASPGDEQPVPEATATAAGDGGSSGDATTPERVDVTAGDRTADPTTDDRTADATADERGAEAAGASGSSGDTRGERRVPEPIPRAPDVEVDYGALTDREPVGGGGNADVERATLPTGEGDVDIAIKTPRLSGTMHADAVERLLAEAETWAKLDDHDHVVGVVDYGAEPLPWIAMEYMDAGHLGERAGDLGASQALWTALAVTNGVRHAHRRGVAHLDLKPANVLFRSVDGSWDVPKVADWGLSKHLLDHSASVEGLSPQYAAPEQFDDDRGPADDITDVYQLGALFYELFTGRPPFEGNPTQVMRAVLDEEPAPPSDVADVPPALDDVLLGMLATDREDRYDSVVYVRDALQDVYDDH